MTNIVGKTNWPLILVAYLSLFCLGLLDNARGPYFADIMSDLSLTNTQGSLFFATVSSMAFFTAWLVPRLVRAFSLLIVVRGAIFTMGVGFAFVSQAQNLTALVITSIVFGLGFGILNVAQNLLVLEGASAHMRRRLFSGLHGMYAFSSWLAPLVAAYLYRLQMNWRQAFIGFASVVILSFVATFFVKNQSRSSAELAKPQKTSKPKLHAYGLIGSIISLYVVAELIVSTRLPLFVRQVHGYTPEQASHLLAMFFLLLLIGRFMFLFIPFKHTNIKIIEMGLVLTFVAFALGLFVHPWLFVLTGLTMAPIFGLSIDTVAEMFPEFSTDAVSSVIGLTCVFIVSMHMIIGLLSDLFGISKAMYVGLLCLFLAWVLVAKLQRKK